jgi:hypothetical protein
MEMMMMPTTELCEQWSTRKRNGVRSSYIIAVQLALVELYYMQKLPFGIDARCFTKEDDSEDS